MIGVLTWNMDGDVCSIVFEFGFFCYLNLLSFRFSFLRGKGGDFGVREMEEGDFVWGVQWGRKGVGNRDIVGRGQRSFGNIEWFLDTSFSQFLVFRLFRGERRGFTDLFIQFFIFVFLVCFFVLWLLFDLLNNVNKIEKRLIYTLFIIKGTDQKDNQDNFIVF